MTRTTYYLAGPMSGYPEYNFPAFEAAADDLRKRGLNGHRLYDILSPVDITRELWREKYGREFNPMKDKAEWGDPIVSEMLQRDLAAVFKSDGIILLPGWEQSKGANIELAVAKQVGKLILTYNPTTMELKVVAPNDITPRLIGNFSAASSILQVPEVRPPETPLQEAQRLVHGDRGADYGHPYDDYACTGAMWEAMLRHRGATIPVGTISPDVACLMMAGVKISRAMHRTKRDNYVDIAGYAECAWMCVERGKEMAKP